MRPIVDSTSSSTSLMRYVYGWMIAALCFTAATAYFVSTTSLLVVAVKGWWLWPLLSLAFAFYVPAQFTTLSVSTLQLLIMGYAVIQGMTFGIIVPIYAYQYGGDLIWIAFATAAVSFTVAAVYGSVTRSDLSQMGPMLRAGLLALIVLTLFNMFLASSALMYVLSYLGVVVHLGLAMSSAQMLQRLSWEVEGASDAMVQKAGLMIALQMYINLIMLFWYMLRILSARRR